MKNIIFIFVCLLFLSACNNTPKQETIASKTPEQVKEDSIKNVEKNRISNLNFVRFTKNFIKKNPNWLNNSATKKEGNKKFKKLLSENFSEIVKYNGFTLDRVLISDGKRTHVVLSGANRDIWISIVGTLDKSVNINNLKEGRNYSISSGKFIRFIDFYDLSNLTGWEFRLMTGDFGKDSMGYHYGSSYWKNIILK